MKIRKIKDDQLQLVMCVKIGIQWQFRQLCLFVQSVLYPFRTFYNSKFAADQCGLLFIVSMISYICILTGIRSRGAGFLFLAGVKCKKGDGLEKYFRFREKKVGEMLDNIVRTILSLFHQITQIKS